MSSRFFAAGSASDSDSEPSSSDYSELEEQDHSEDEDEIGDEDEDESGHSDDDEGPQRMTRDFFLRDRAASDDSDEDDHKRVVKSAKDKRWQEIEATSKVIENGGKINDWVVISNGTQNQSPKV
jgi:translation initiation factor 3 subunit C